MKSRRLWCIGLGLVTGVGALLWLGVRPWTIAFALLMLVCAAVIIWVVAYARRTFPPARFGERGLRCPLPGGKRAGDA